MSFIDEIRRRKVVRVALAAELEDWDHPSSAAALALARSTWG
jgi:hypothetical protein